jgi:N-acetylglutamate synthase-like GNAT family acetyltransferase
MHIRKALASENEILTDLALASKAYWGYSEQFMKICAHELLVSEDDLLNPAFSYWVAQVDNTIVGFIALKPQEENIVELDALFVSPEYINKRIGQALFSHVLPLLKISSYTKLVILSDPQAAGFYEKMGASYVGTKASGSIKERLLPVYELPLL